MSRNQLPTLEPIECDINPGIVNIIDNTSGASIDGSSLITDARPLMHRNGSFSNGSCVRVHSPSIPLSPINISASLVMEGSSIMQQGSQQEVQKQGTRSVASQPTIQESDNLTNPHKRPRFDMRRNILQQQMIQQLLERHEPMQQQSHQMQAMQQQKLMHHQSQQQQIMQSLNDTLKTPITLQQAKLMRQHTQEAVQLGTPGKRFFDTGICSRRLMQYLYHQRNRPSDNSLQFWRKFVTEYFSPQAKKRWCVSMYNNYGNNAPVVFPRSAVDPWQCNMCGAESGKGYEATYEVLPRLFQTKFDHNFIDEHLFLDMPNECRLSSGIMMLDYGKVAHESVYEDHRVIHIGQLRIIFTPELKILYWEFCARSHEEFLSRKLLASKVNQLFHVAQKYQSSVDESRSITASNQDLQASCDMFVATACQLVKQLELQNLNDMGFSERYIRFFEISEVVCSMMNEIDFSQEQKMGPVESLKNYTQLAAAKLQKQKLDSEQLIDTHGILRADQSNLTNSSNINSGMKSHMNNNPAVPILSNNQHNVLALNDNQKFMRSTNANKDVLLGTKSHMNNNSLVVPIPSNTQHNVLALNGNQNFVRSTNSNQDVLLGTKSHMNNNSLVVPIPSGNWYNVLALNDNQNFMRSINSNQDVLLGMKSHMNNNSPVLPIPSSNPHNFLALNDNQNFMRSTNSNQDVLLGMKSDVNNNSPVVPIPSSNQHNVLALNDYQNFMRNTNSSQIVLQQELSNDVNTPGQPQSTRFQRSASSILSNQSGRCAAGPHHRQHSLDGNLPQKNSLRPAQGNQQLQQHVIHQMTPQVMNDSGEAGQQCQSSPITSVAPEDVSSVGTAVRRDPGSNNNALELQNMPAGGIPNPTRDAPDRSNSVKTTANSPTISDDGLNFLHNFPEIPPDLDMPDLDDISEEFAQNGMFNDW